MKIKNGKTNSTAENSLKYLCLCPCNTGNRREFFSNEFTDKLFCLWPNLFVCKTFYALDMPQVTSQVKGGLFINAHTKLYYFIFHKCGDNETIPKHFYCVN